MLRKLNPFTVTVLGNHNEVFRLLDGTTWQVQYEYEYLYEYYPTVVVCPSRGVLLINGKRLDVRQLGGPTVTGGAVIESQVDGEFEGWEGETVVVLTNGQIWQQAGYEYEYHYAYSPDVLIFRADGRYMMQVEGVDEPVRVIRLQ